MWANFSVSTTGDWINLILMTCDLSVSKMGDILYKVISMNYLIVSLVLFATCAWAQDEVLFADSPHRSVSRTRQMLDATDLRVLLPLAMSICRNAGC